MSQRQPKTPIHHEVGIPIKRIDKDKIKTYNGFTRTREKEKMSL